MSTRWYPLYQRGNPQLRVFLPNFWMKLVKSEHKQPDNVVTFHVSMEMTQYDIKSYLKNIYKLPVMDVRTRIAPGSTQRDKVIGYVTKNDDRKLAYVTLPRETKFKFPDLFPSEAEAKKQQREDEKPLEASKDQFKKYLERNSKRKGMPGWFSI